MSRRIGCLLCAAFLLCLLVLAPLGCAEADFTGLTVEILDVGQSDCTLVTLGDSVLMIDCGTVTERHTVQTALRTRGIERIDYLVLTHPHEDHIGNARMLLETYTVGALIVPPIASEQLDYRLVTDAAARCEVPVQCVAAGATFDLDSATVEILQAGTDAEDPNNSSVVLTVTYGETKFLFTGDNEEAGETCLLAGVPAEKLDCDFLKAGHHGSANATGAALLATATPAHVAFSCGVNNGYGFPADAVLERLRAVNALWHRTDTEGDLRYVSDGHSVIYAE